MQPDSFIGVVVGLLIVLLAIHIVRFGLSSTQLSTTFRLCTSSAWYGCDTFYEWVQMIQCHLFLQYTDHSNPGVEIPSCPHLILCNHITSHSALGSFMSVAGCIRSPCNVVCYQDYKHMYIMHGVVNRVLQSEIRVDVKLSKTDKETRMIAGIQSCLDDGKNVVMFIDAHTSTQAIRTLNHKVLSAFPNIYKQLVHIMEPTESSHFHYMRLPSTRCLETIVRYRQVLLSSESGYTSIRDAHILDHQVSKATESTTSDRFD
jgi:hypothetical protein